MPNTEQFERDRQQQLASSLINLSTFGGRCDVTFFNRPPLLDVKVPERIALALGYGAGAKKMQQLLSSIEFSDGTIASLGEIWMLFPLPKSGISPEQLAEVDLKDADSPSPNGKSMREMIKEMYQCKSRDEEDRFLRRYMAS